MTKPTPIIHLNGTSRESLIREYEALNAALKEVEARLVDCTLHRRDFYVSDDDPHRWFNAVTWRREMWEHIEALQAYTSEHLLALLPPQ